MNNARPLRFTTAGFLLVVAALGYVGLIALAIPNGRVYLSALGGNEPTPLAVMVAVFGPLAVLAVLLAREVFASVLSQEWLDNAGPWPGWFRPRPSRRMAWGRRC